MLNLEQSVNVSEAKSDIYKKTNKKKTLMFRSGSSPGSRPLPVRRQTRLRGTGTGWMPSWTGWPACCHSPLMSSPSWTSCRCFVSQFPTSASKVSSKVGQMKRWHLWLWKGLCVCVRVWPEVDGQVKPIFIGVFIETKTKTKKNTELKFLFKFAYNKLHT